jgi:hypothetical protein
LRLGDYAGVRYNIKSATDSFEIYNVVTDPAQLHNLAPDGKQTVPVHLPYADTLDNSVGTSIADLQAYLTERVLQLHHSGSGSPRPYDDALVPAVPVKMETLSPGIDWKIYRGSFPWIPQESGLTSVLAGHGAIPELSDEGKKTNTLTVFTGYIAAPKDGEYTFYMSCDAKAFLRIHDIQVIDADYGYPGNLPRIEKLFLKAGLHPFSFYYYRNEDKGDPFVKLDWSGPGMPRKKMQQPVFFSDKAQRE